MRKFLFLIGALALLMAGYVVPARAGDVPRWSFDRREGGVTAAGLVQRSSDNQQSSGFAPDAYLTYNLSQNLYASASARHDFASDFTTYKAGGRFMIWGSEQGTRLHASLGVDYVDYEGDGAAGIAKNTSWLSSIRFAWSAVNAPSPGPGIPGRTIIYTVLYNEYDAENRVNFTGLGLRWSIFGGSAH